MEIIIMKRFFLSAVLALTVTASLAGCGFGKGNSDDGSTSTAVNYGEQLKKDIEDYKQYVQLGQYKGIAVTVDAASLEVSDEDVTAYIDNLRSNFADTNEITEGVTKNGDTITLDYSGTLDGVAFSGGTATDVQYTVGSGRFITDLDEGLVGLEVGKEYAIPCTFPDTYYSTDLAGKDVVFTVTVSSITEQVLPDYDADFVAKLVATGNYDTDATTTEEFTAYAKQYLQDMAKSSYESSCYSEIWTALDENTTVSGYPEEELNSTADTIKTNVRSEYEYYGSYYGITSFEDYLSQVYGIADEDELATEAEEYAKSYLKEKMVLTLIAGEEGITVTDDELRSYGEEIAVDNGYESYDKLIEELGEDIQLEVGYSAMAEKVVDLLIASCVNQ